MGCCSVPFKGLKTSMLNCWPCSPSLGAVEPQGHCLDEPDLEAPPLSLKMSPLICGLRSTPAWKGSCEEEVSGVCPMPRAALAHTVAA